LFADYIVFADESGDHGMETIDPSFPAFCLVFCVFEKNTYLEQIEPALRRFKFKHFGHDAVVLHEREIRKQEPPFDFLRRDPEQRRIFFDDLNALMSGISMTWFASVIDKNAHRAKYRDPWNPYEIAMHFCMEKTCLHLRRQVDDGHKLHVMFEARGGGEDASLELQFRRIASDEAHWGWRRPNFRRLSWEPVFTSKAANLAGHQISDLMARPLALRHLRPEQPNRAVDAIWPQRGFWKVFP